jgi:replicative DNA helicase
VIIAKHRNGPVGAFDVAFISKYAKFATLAH